MYRFIKVGMLVTGCSWGALSTALAVDANETNTASADQSALMEDILVTAQRREQSLLETPVAVVVISAKKLAEANIVSEYDLQRVAPGLQVRSGASSTNVNYSLRGQSLDPFSSARPGVLPYFNDVQIGAPATSSTFYDLQSVQVLKGPQGTLFGRSATGGAILFNTVKPSEETGGYISGLYGNYNQYKIEGAINIPISGDKVMARIAGFYRGRDGFQTNLFDGGTDGDLEQYGLRGSLTAQLSPSIRNELVVDYSDADNENTVGVISGLLPFTGGATAPFVPAEFLYAGVGSPLATFTGQCTLQAFVGIPGACPPASPAVAGFYDAFFANPQVEANGVAQVLTDQNARGPFVIASDAANIFQSQNLMISNTTTIDLGENLQLKNIFGYVDITNFSAQDADGTPFGVISGGPKGRTDIGLDNKLVEVSNELQLLGKTLDGNLDYVVGVYYSHDRSTTFQFSYSFDVLFGGAIQQNAFEGTNETIAGYAQATYDLGDNFSVTAGGRYTSEDVRNVTQPEDTNRIALGNPAPAGFDYDQSGTFTNFSYIIGLQYEASSELFFYANHRRAYKSGGFNGLVSPRVGPAENAGSGFLSERVTDVEAGMKYNGALDETPIRANFVFYYSWIRNSQRTGMTLITGVPAALTVNVPKGTTYGFEIDGEIKPVEWLTLGGNFNYTEAGFSEGDVTLVGASVTYDQVTNTPKYNAVGYAEARFPLEETGLTVLLYGDVYYQSEGTISPRSANFAGTTLPSYTLAGFRVGILNDAAGWSLMANLKNAFNKVFYTGGLQTGEIFQINTRVPGDPRTFTVELRKTF